MEESTVKSEVTSRRKPKRKKAPPRKKNNAAGQRLRELYADPVWKAQQLEKMNTARAKALSEDPLRFTRQGVPDGMRKKEAEKKMAEAKESAKETVEVLAANGFFKDDESAAKEALEFNISVMRSPYGMRERLAAASKVLEYTKSKPVAKSEVTVNKAEEWLATVAAEIQDDKAEPSGDQESA